MSYRSPSAALLTALAKPVTHPIWLIEIALTSTVRYTSRGSTLTYDGDAYSHVDFQLRTPTIGNDGSSRASIEFQNVDQTFTALFRQGDAEGAAVKVWYTEDMTTHTATGDALQIIESTINQVRVAPNAVTLQLARQPQYAPTKTVDAANGFTNVTPPGVQQYPGGTQVLT